MDLEDLNKDPIYVPLSELYDSAYRLLNYAETWHKQLEFFIVRENKEYYYTMRKETWDFENSLANFRIKTKHYLHLPDISEPIEVRLKLVHNNIDMQDHLCHEFAEDARKFRHSFEVQVVPSLTQQEALSFTRLSEGLD